MWRAAQRTVRLLALLAGLSLAGACLSPTLPLPPPDATQVGHIDAGGEVTIAGAAGAVDVGSVVYAYNQRLGEGAIVRSRDDGSYSLRVHAAAGDAVNVWFEQGETTSDIAVVYVSP